MSREDLAGNDPLIRNSETRILVGYEREIAMELTASAQYVTEVLSDFDALKSALPSGARQDSACYNFSHDKTDV